MTGIRLSIRPMLKKDVHGRTSLDMNDLVKDVLKMIELDLRIQRVSTATPRNPAKSNTGFRPLLPAAQALSEFFTVDYLEHDAIQQKSYRRILVTEGVRRQRLELAI